MENTIDIDKLGEDLRVAHITNVPDSPHYVNVRTLREAMLVMDTLANYDNYLYEQNLITDYSNTSWLEVFEYDEWLEWNSPDGETIDEIVHLMDMNEESEYDDDNVTQGVYGE